MRNKNILVWAAATLALGLFTAACGDDSDNGGNGGSGGGGGTGGSGGDCQTILEIASETEELSSLVAAVEAAGLDDALAGDDLTVFAPTNDAFTDLLTALDLEFGDLTEDNLVPILTYHVIGQTQDSAELIGVATSEDNTVTTLGGTVQLDVVDENLVLDQDEASATVVTADIEACNGIVHVIDAVIVPSITDIVVSQERFSGLETLIGASDTSTVDVAAALDGPAANGAWTLFAPNNAAVADGPSGLTPEQVTTALLYHAYDAETAVDAATAVTLDTDIEMKSGELLSVLGDEDAGTVTLTDGADEDSMVTAVDIYAFNGIIHEIDGVLIPPSLVP